VGVPRKAGSDMKYASAALGGRATEALEKASPVAGPFAEGRVARGWGAIRQALRVDVTQARGHVSPQPREGLGGRRTAWAGAGDRVTLKAWYRSRDLNPDEVALNGV
jgi:hypothetical protein